MGLGILAEDENEYEEAEEDEVYLALVAERSTLRNLKELKFDEDVVNYIGASGEQS